MANESEPPQLRIVENEGNQFPLYSYIFIIYIYSMHSPNLGFISSTARGNRRVCFPMSPRKPGVSSLCGPHRGGRGGFHDHLGMEVFNTTWRYRWFEDTLPDACLQCPLGFIASGGLCDGMIWNFKLLNKCALRWCRCFWNEQVTVLEIL